MQRPYFQAGFTLVELMIVVAILSIIAAIAIPAYQGYIREARLGTARLNADSLRVFLEDYQLDNGTYIGTSGSSPYDKAELNTNFGWTPDGDNNQYSYNVWVSTNSYDIAVTHIPSGSWIRCENRMSSCCDSNTSGATSASSACPPLP